MTSATKDRTMESTPRRRPSRTVVFCLVGALVFFFGPGVAYLFGERPQAIDNRPLAAAPSVRQGWDAFGQAQLWANDHLPLRSKAVKLATGISQDVFHEAPHFGSSAGLNAAGAGGAASTQSAVAYPKVIEGADGWLFSGDDVAVSCEPVLSIPVIMDGFQKLADAAATSGRKIVIMIAPDKSSAHPEKLPDQFAGKACMHEKHDAFWAAAKQLHGVTLLDPKPELAAYEEETGRVAWRTLDTHWSPEGAAVGADTLAQALDPSIAATSTIETGPDLDALGDLTALLGASRTEKVPSAALDRPGVELHYDGRIVGPNGIPDLGYKPTTVTATTSSAPLLPGRTLVIGDSFFRTTRGNVAVLAESLTYVHNLAPDKPGGTKAVANALADSDTLVYELAERLAVGGKVSFQEPANVDALVKAMIDHPRH